MPDPARLPFSKNNELPVTQSAWLKSLQTVFLADTSQREWPSTFHIITAYNPNRIVTETENHDADRRLQVQLENERIGHFRIVGCSRDLLHREACWGVAGVSLDYAVQLGRLYIQSTIFEVTHGEVFAVSCDTRERQCLGLFRDRLKIQSTHTGSTAALADSAKGLAAVAGGQDYTGHNWLPSAARLNVFAKFSRRRTFPANEANQRFVPHASDIREHASESQCRTLSAINSFSPRFEKQNTQLHDLDQLIDIVNHAAVNFPDIFREEARIHPAGATRAAEGAALLAYAAGTETLLDPFDFFCRWKESGANGGQEHQVVVGDAGEPVLKRTHMPYFHESWSGYFNRIKLHNILFPEAPIAVRGFQNQTRNLGTPYGDVLPPGVYCVTEQPFVNWEREATADEINAYLQSGGFEKVRVPEGERDKGEWFNPDAGVHLVDVRGDNIVVVRGRDGLLRPVALDIPIY